MFWIMIIETLLLTDTILDCGLVVNRRTRLSVWRSRETDLYREDRRADGRQTIIRNLPPTRHKQL